MNDASIHSANYYRGRERAERELADQAASISIQKIHLELADRYRALATQQEQSPPSQLSGDGNRKQSSAPV